MQMADYLNYSWPVPFRIIISIALGAAAIVLIAVFFCVFL
jgi:hypothetical protein